MRVLITGGAGRLGRTVATDFADRGHAVTSADRTRSVELDAADLDQIVTELTADGAIADLVEEVRPDAIIHLAAIPVPFVRPDDETFRVNTSLAHAVCDAGVALGVASVVLASSPTVIGYGAPGWRPRYLPLDEEHPVEPWHSYALSKVATEEMARMFARRGTATRFFAFRPCYVIAPEEWAGAPTQAGHTVAERLDDPSLAAVSLFNYCDARDVADFLDHLVCLDDATAARADGETFFVGAADAMSRTPLADVLPREQPATAGLAAGLTGDASAFSVAKAARLLGWAPTRSWRTELTT